MGSENNPAGKSQRPRILPPHLYRPGQTGNAGGRPKGYRSFLQQKYGLKGEKLFEFLDRLKDGKISTVEYMVGVDGPVKIKRKPTIRERLSAVETLLAYALGKPPSSLEISGPDGGPLEISAQRTLPDFGKFTDAELEAYENHLKALAALKQKALPTREDDPQKIVEGEVVS